MRKERQIVKATRKVEAQMMELCEIRATLKGLIEQEKAIQAQLVDFIGDWDGISGVDYEASLARCEGNTSWKAVAEALVTKYDVPPSVLVPIVTESKGGGYVRLAVKELVDG